VAAAGGYLVTRPRPPAASRSGPATDSIALADSAVGTCRAAAGDAQMDCYDAFLVPLVASHGVRTTMGALHVLGTRDDQVRADGHVYAHAIGIAAGRAGRADVGRAFADCNEIFQSGCYHGVIQAYFEDVRAVDTATANRLCSAFRSPSADQWLRFQCVHGMGHGLMMVYDHDLPRALTGCDLLSEGWDRESCYGGAFMENVVNATQPHHAAHALHSHAAAHTHGAAPAFKALDPNDLQYPCSIVGQRYLVACYNMQTSVMLYFTHGDMAAAAHDRAGVFPGPGSRGQRLRATGPPRGDPDVLARQRGVPAVVSRRGGEELHRPDRQARRRHRVLPRRDGIGQPAQVL